MRLYDVTLSRWAAAGQYIHEFGGMSAATDCEYVLNTFKHD